jgi:hypothetical protein
MRRHKTLRQSSRRQLATAQQVYLVAGRDGCTGAGAAITAPSIVDADPAIELLENQNLYTRPPTGGLVVFVPQFGARTI